jgi:hypothetical protein
LRLRLESALDPPGQDLEAAVEAAIATADRMETTIDSHWPAVHRRIVA